MAHQQHTLEVYTVSCLDQSLHANLSGVNFVALFNGSVVTAENLSQKQLNKAWAWEDNPPIFKVKDDKGNLTGLDFDVPLYPKSVREAYIKSRRSGLPKGSPINR